MKRKVIPVLIGLLLIVLILAGAAGVFLFQRYSGSKEEADLNAYFGLNGSQEVAIVWNQELTEEKGLLQDERCYLKLDTVHEMLNERFYVDHNEKLLLYTLPEETVQIGIGEQTADGYTAAVEQNGDVWLALDYVKQYSDFNYALYTEPNRVVLTTNWDTLQSAELKKNTALRVRGGVKSEVLQNLEKRDEGHCFGGDGKLGSGADAGWLYWLCPEKALDRSGRGNSGEGHRICGAGLYRQSAGP